jgi:hypothetical protein
MKTFTTLKLAIAALGVASLASDTMLGQTLPKPTLPKFPTELASVFNEDILNSLPLNLNDALPTEALEEFRKVKAENIDSNKKYVAFLKKVYPYVEKHTITTKVTVVDETENPIEGASAWVVEIRGTNKSQALYMNSDSYVPYKIKKKTQKNGLCVFENIPRFNEIVLSYWLFAEKKKEIPPNLQLTVKAQGYETVKKEFLNWDKKTLAFSTYLMATMLKVVNATPAEELEKRKFPKFAKKITIPQENLGDVIEIKVVLKKEKPKPTEGSAGNKDKGATPKQQPVAPSPKK